MPYSSSLSDAEWEIFEPRANARKLLSQNSEEIGIIPPCLFALGCNARFGRFVLSE